MKNPNKKNIEEKKIHPFLFLISLFLVGLVTTSGWNMWKEKTTQQKLQDVIRSADIELLLSGDVFSKGTKQSEISSKLKQDVEILSTEQLLKNQKSETQIQKQDNILDTDKIPANNDPPATPQDIVNLALRDIFISQGENGVENWRLIAEWATVRQTTSILNLSKPSLLYRTGDQITLNYSDKKKDKKITDAEQVGDISKTKLSPSKDKNNTNIKPFKIISTQKIKNKENLNDPLKDFYANSEGMLSITAKNGIIFNQNTEIRLTEEVFAKQNTNYVKGDTLDYNDITRIATFPHSAIFAGDNIEGKALVLDWDLNKNQLIGKGKVEMTWMPSKKKLK